MRSALAATLVILVSAVTAQAQTTPYRRKAETGRHRRSGPALQTPTDTANAMAQAERMAIQSDLAWVGHYNGAINGEVSDRMVAAIKAFQKDHGGQADRRAQSAGARRALGGREKDARKMSAGRSYRRRHRRAARYADKTGAATNQRRQRHQMGDRPPAPSRSRWRGARKPIRPRRNSPSRRRKSRPGARSTTAWSSRISSCCRACRA